MEDILQMAAQMVDIQPLKRALGGNIYLELTEWNGSKRVDLRFWKDSTVPTKERVSLRLDQWKALCNMSDVIDDFLTSVIDNEPVGIRILSQMVNVPKLPCIGGVLLPHLTREGK
jgi:hypothetical protein